MVTSIMVASVIIMLLSSILILNDSTLALSSSLQTGLLSIANNFSIKEYPVPHGSHPHDVSPSNLNQDNKNNNTIVWFTAQATGQLGKLETSGQTHLIQLGQGSAPHGVIICPDNAIGPDNAPWITDGGLNAIVRIDPKTEEVKIF
jgi:virginiamycin B lyase